jgi:hypothetical protein
MVSLEMFLKYTNLYHIKPSSLLSYFCSKTNGVSVEFLVIPFWAI